jgi:hypothetical protein
LSENLQGASELPAGMVQEDFLREAVSESVWVFADRIESSSELGQPRIGGENAQVLGSKACDGVGRNGVSREALAGAGLRPGPANGQGESSAVALVAMGEADELRKVVDFGVEVAYERENSCAQGSPPSNS